MIPTTLFDGEFPATISEVPVRAPRVVSGSRRRDATPTVQQRLAAVWAVYEPLIKEAKKELADKEAVIAAQYDACVRPYREFRARDLLAANREHAALVNEIRQQYNARAREILATAKDAPR